jgi:hypothetical protein
LLPLLIGCLASALCLIGAFVCLRRKRYVDDLPTSKTQGVFIGLTELKGTAESESPLTSYLAGARCVWYGWKVKEHWSRTVTYMDKNGVHTRTESGWKEVASGGEEPPFYLKDDTGVLRIVPHGANIHGESVFDRTCRRQDSLYYDKGPAGAVSDSTHQRRFHETAMPLHAMLYIMGQAREREDVVAAEVACDKACPMFLISTKTEKQISSGYNVFIWAWSMVGIICALVGAAVSTQMFNSGAQWFPFAVALGVYFVVLILGWTWTVYNSLVTLRNRVDQAWSQLDIQLKRRIDLIPNLVECVKGYSAHEAAVQQLVADLRTLGQTHDGRGGIKGYSGALIAVAERYPALKADQSFLVLQKSLADTEGRIALARGYFNDIVTFYNTRLEVVPDRFVGRLARLFKQNLIQTADLGRAPVEVKLTA